MHEVARTKLICARIALLSEQPFFGTLALRLEIIEDTTCKTLWVDGKRVGYNPDFVMMLTHSETKFVMAHEVSHCVFEHIARRGDRNPKKWNQAGDYVINDILIDAGFVMPEVGLHDLAFKGMSADHVYSLLPDSPEGEGGPGDVGSGGSLDEVRDADTKDDVSSIDEWKLAAAQAANAAKQAGKLPNSLERLVGEILYPKADWRSILRRFVTEKSKNDYSWARPKKMMIPLGYYLPTLYSESMGTIVVVSDDSGSIGGAIQQAFASEIQGIRDAVSPLQTIFISCDARINHTQKFDQYEPFVFTSKGGGGTDFRPPFDWIEEQGIVPAALVYLTDLYGPAPDVAPPYPVLWCCTTDQTGPWGETVTVEV